MLRLQSAWQRMAASPCRARVAQQWHRSAASRTRRTPSRCASQDHRRTADWCLPRQPHRDYSTGVVGLEHEPVDAAARAARGPASTRGEDSSAAAHGARLALRTGHRFRVCMCARRVAASTGAAAAPHHVQSRGFAAASEGNAEADTDGEGSWPDSERIDAGAYSWADPVTGVRAVAAAARWVDGDGGHASNARSAGATLQAGAARKRGSAARLLEAAVETLHGAEVGDEGALPPPTLVVAFVRDARVKRDAALRELPWPRQSAWPALMAMTTAATRLAGSREAGLGGGEATENAPSVTIVALHIPDGAEPAAVQFFASESATSFPHLPGGYLERIVRSPHMAPVACLVIAREASEALPASMQRQFSLLQVVLNETQVVAMAPRRGPIVQRLPGLGDSERSDVANCGFMLRGGGLPAGVEPRAEAVGVLFHAGPPHRRENAAHRVARAASCVMGATGWTSAWALQPVVSTALWQHLFDTDAVARLAAVDDSARPSQGLAGTSPAQHDPGFLEEWEALPEAPASMDIFVTHNPALPPPAVGVQAQRLRTSQPCVAAAGRAAPRAHERGTSNCRGWRGQRRHCHSVSAESS